jgi:hypothetical protein
MDNRSFFGFKPICFELRVRVVGFAENVDGCFDFFSRNRNNGDRKLISSSGGGPELGSV